MIGEKKYLEDTKVYLNEEQRSKVVWELLSYSHMIYKRVYVFQNLEAFANSFKDEPSKEYWEVMHYEKLIDQIKICIAFENFNKAILLSKGYLVHSIDKKKNRILAERQKNQPISIAEFTEFNQFKQDRPHDEWYLEGLENFKTISFSQTLKEEYQSVVNLNADFLNYLKNINKMRNRLHFYKNHLGANRMSSLIQSFEFARSYGTQLLVNELESFKKL